MGGVQVAFRVEALGVKVPPAVEDQIPPVADPPMLPERFVVVPPWHMVWSIPTVTVGVGKTTMLTAELTALQGLVIPVVVNVNRAVPL